MQTSAETSFPNLRIAVAPIAGTGRFTVARLIERELGGGVTLAHDPHGAPLLEGSQMRISVSHSRRWAAIGLHPTLRIGIDIEEPRTEQLQRVAPRFLGAAEMPLWSNRLLRAWTCKEAVYKAAGCPGLALADIDLTAEGTARIPDGRCFRLLTDETPDYTLTIAIPEKP